MTSTRFRTAGAAALAAFLAAPSPAVCGPIKEAVVPMVDAPVKALDLSTPQAASLAVPDAAAGLAAPLSAAAPASGAAAAAAMGAFGKQGTAAAAETTDAGEASEGSAARSAAEFDGASAASRLHESEVAKYSAADRSVGLLPARLPLSMGDYFFHWTRKSKDLQRIGRQTLMRPTVDFWAAAAPAPFNAYWRKMKALLDFIDRVEAKPPEWSTPNKVVIDDAGFRLRDFGAHAKRPADKTKAPILIVPPNSGHLSTIADYDDGKSVVQTFLKSGRSTLALEWKSAMPDNPQLISDMVADVVKSIDAAGGKVQLVGLCQGGWVAAIVNALYPEKVQALYLAGTPLDATRGDNDITRVSRDYPIEFFNWLVHGIGKADIQDGENQLEGFLSLGPDGGRAKRVDFWTELFNNIDDPVYVARAERFARWFYHVNDLSLWYLEAIDKIFKGNQLYKGTMRIQVGDRLRTVDLSRIKNPIVMLEGTKDDITPPASVAKEDLAGVTPDPDAAWTMLNREGLIADHGEELVNRKPGERAVIEPKLFSTSFKAFRKLGPLATRPLYDFLLAQQGQSFALENAASAPKDARFKRTLNVGHIGLYNSSGAQTVWTEAQKWVDGRLAAEQRK